MSSLERARTANAPPTVRPSRPRPAMAVLATLAAPPLLPRAPRATLGPARAGRAAWCGRAVVADDLEIGPERLSRLDVADRRPSCGNRVALAIRSAAAAPGATLVTEASTSAVATIREIARYPGRLGSMLLRWRQAWCGVRAGAV